MANTIPAVEEWQGTAALCVSFYWSFIWDTLPTAVLPNVSFHVCSPLEVFYRTILLLLEGRWQLEVCTWKMCKYLNQHPIISARKEVGTGPAVKPFQSLSGHKTHTWWSSQTLCVCVICSLLQGNVWPHALRRTALHKTEKRGCLKARNGTGVREFAAWVDWSCSYLCFWKPSP